MNRRLFSACIGLFAALGGMTSTGVQAGGHGHHHHGHGGWHVDFIFGGGGWPGYYRPYPYYNYYYPPPVVYAAPTVVTVPQLTSFQSPQITVPATASTNSVAPSSSTAVRSNNAPRTAGVTIRNPIASGTTIAFVVDSRTEAELAPGETMPLVEKNSYFIEFDRGGDFGTSKKTLGEGTYEFVATDKGWDLQPADNGGVTPTPVVRRNTLPTTR